MALLQTVVDSPAPLRLDKWLAQKLTGQMSRSQVKNLIENGAVTVDGRISTHPSKTVASGQKVVIEHEPESNKPGLEPSDQKLKIVFEDEHLLVIDKPNDLVVHPGAGNKSGTLANAIVGYLGEEIDGRSGLVHRIDKQTTGLLLVAKDSKTLEALNAQMKLRKISRKYIAVVKGIITPESAKIDAPIGRSRTNRLKMAVTAFNSKPAVTHVKVLKRGVNWTAIECTLETGRTHQIRVHLAYIKHPLLGDVTYGGSPLPDNYGQLLHAYSLEFVHPVSKKKIKCESELPAEFDPYIRLKSKK